MQVYALHCGGDLQDVAIFDPEDFRDRATYADPHQFPSGERTCVIVNGVIGGCPMPDMCMGDEAHFLQNLEVSVDR